MGEGWIKIHRGISSHWIWKDSDKLKWWLDILLQVNHAPNKVNIGNQLYECGRGQSVMSLGTWANRWGVSKDKARNFLVLLEKDGMISHESLGKTTRITVCNYGNYQDGLHDSQTQDQRPNNDSQTPSHTNNNDNNTNNENNVNKVKRETKRFTKPTLNEVADFILENSFFIDAEKFFNYYESNGWKVGRNSMKDWKATVKNWNSKEKEKSSGKKENESKTPVNRNYEEGF